MGAYTVFLCLGNNLVCRSILSTTIRGYLKALDTLFQINQHPSPLLDSTGQEAQCIESIIKEQSVGKYFPTGENHLLWKW